MDIYSGYTPYITWIFIGSQSPYKGLQRGGLNTNLYVVKILAGNVRSEATVRPLPH